MSTKSLWIATLCMVPAFVRGQMPRVRTTNETIVVVMEAAERQSPTFRGLINVINSSDGLVYVDDGACPGRYRACLMHSVTLAGPNRLLRIKVDVRRSDGELIPLLGHELQHAVEILSNHALRNNAQMLTFYQSAGTFGGSHILETEAAVKTQQKISREIRNADAQAATTPCDASTLCVHNLQRMTAEDWSNGLSTRSPRLSEQEHQQAQIDDGERSKKPLKFHRATSTADCTPSLAWPRGLIAIALRGRVD